MYFVTDTKQKNMNVQIIKKSTLPILKNIDL